MAAQVADAPRAAGNSAGEDLPLQDRPANGAAPSACSHGSMTWLAGGAFLMGSNSFYREERPVRPEFVEGFWIDTHPVTNAAFHKFVDATGYVTYSERPP